MSDNKQENKQQSKDTAFQNEPRSPLSRSLAYVNYSDSPTFIKENLSMFHVENREKDENLNEDENKVSEKK